MAVIPSEKQTLVRQANKKLFEELYNLFEFWDIGLWEDTPTSELAEIWCETIREFCPVKYSERTLKKEFVNKIMERLVDV